jgi:hypothetical protein
MAGKKNSEKFDSKYSQELIDKIKAAEFPDDLMKCQEILNTYRNALIFYAEGWHYRMLEDGDVEIETGEYAAKGLIAGYKITGSKRSLKH